MERLDQGHTTERHTKFQSPNHGDVGWNFSDVGKRIAEQLMGFSPLITGMLDGTDRGFRAWGDGWGGRRPRRAGFDGLSGRSESSMRRGRALLSQIGVLRRS